MTVRWVTRQQSGLAAPNQARLSPREDRIVGYTKHHTGGAAPRTALDSLKLWRDLQAQAMSGNNVNHTRYGDIEYNVGFDDFGQLLIGRDPGVVGAHATSTNNTANRITLGVAYLGTGDPSPLAMQALGAYAWVVATLIHHAPLRFAHSDWVNYGGIATACPGPALAHSLP